MTNEQKPGIWLTLLVLVGAYFAVTAWNLHLQTIANPDEPRYACPARQMIRGADPLVPEFNTRPRLVKPILFYWLIAATGAAGQAVGLDLATSLRLGPLLMGWLAVVATYFLGRRLAGPWCGLIAAGVLISTRFFHECSRQLVVDMTLTAFVVWAWLFVHIALERIRTQPRANGFLPLLGFYLSLGLACMTKGPLLVALFVVVPLLVYLAWSRRLRDLRHVGLWWGAPLALAVGLWWFITLWQQGHLKDVRTFFMTENVARAIGGKDHQRYAPFLFYVLDLGQNFVPWVILLPVAAWWSGKRCRASSTDVLARVEAGAAPRGGIARPPMTVSLISDSACFLACALGVSFVMLGLAVSKRALYLLPLYPLFAVWVGWLWNETFLQAKPERRDKRLRVTVVLLAIAGAMWLGYEAIARPVMEHTDNRAAFYREVNEKLGGRPVVLLGLSSNEAVWYLDRPSEPLDDVRFPALRARFFDAPGTKLLVSAKLLDKDAELRKALVLEPLSATRDGERFFLADPDPAAPPSPGVFRTKAERESKAGGED